MSEPLPRASSELVSLSMSDIYAEQVGNPSDGTGVASMDWASFINLSSAQGASTSPNCPKKSGSAQTSPSTSDRSLSAVPDSDVNQLLNDSRNWNPSVEYESIQQCNTNFTNGCSQTTVGYPTYTTQTGQSHLFQDQNSSAAAGMTNMYGDENSDFGTFYTQNDLYDNESSWFYQLSTTDHVPAPYYFTANKENSDSVFFQRPLDPSLKSQAYRPQDCYAPQALMYNPDAGIDRFKPQRYPSDLLLSIPQESTDHILQEQENHFPQLVQRTNDRSNKRRRHRVRRSSPDIQSFDSDETESPDKSSRTKAATVYAPERPKIDRQHEWVRINSSTVGHSTRTGKINRYDPKRDGQYVETRHPFGSWKSTHYKFSYNKAGELANHVYSVNELKEFIYDHPKTAKSHMILWIQKNPADSARRYATYDGSKCRFESCPGARLSRAIGVGSYRVAFDEQWSTYGDLRDPFHVAGHVHLYCLERFFDFKDICKRFDVRADNRDISSEPRGRFGPSLGYEVEYDVAAQFIQSCRDGTLSDTFPDYPVHDDHPAGAPKNHDGTLTCALTRAKISAQSNSRILMQQKRGLKNSHIFVHLGDLQMQVDGRQSAKSERKRERLRNIEELSDDEMSVSSPARSVLEKKRRHSERDEQSDIDDNPIAAKISRLQARPFLAHSKSLRQLRRINYKEDSTSPEPEPVAKRSRKSTFTSAPLLREPCSVADLPVDSPGGNPEQYHPAVAMQMKAYEAKQCFRTMPQKVGAAPLLNEDISDSRTATGQNDALIDPILLAQSSSQVAKLQSVDTSAAERKIARLVSYSDSSDDD